MDRDAICQNCCKIWAENAVRPIWECKDLGQRIMPGEVLPVGECPSCGAFCHYIHEMCRYCYHEEVCGLLRSLKNVLHDHRYYFLGDKGRVSALADVERAVAKNCAMYKGTFVAEED